jgi:hypothetical protein
MADQSLVWASDIGTYWMDFDKNGISLDIFNDSSDSSQGNCQIFIDYKKCKEYSLMEKKTFKVRADALSTDFRNLQNVGKVNVEISLADQSIQKSYLIKDVMDYHSIVIVLLTN